MTSFPGTWTSCWACASFCRWCPWSTAPWPRRSRLLLSSSFSASAPWLSTCSGASWMTLQWRWSPHKTHTSLTTFTLRRIGAGFWWLRWVIWSLLSRSSSSIKAQRRSQRNQKKKKKSLLFQAVRFQISLGSSQKKRKKRKPRLNIKIEGSRIWLRYKVQKNHRFKAVENTVSWYFKYSRHLRCQYT